MDGGKNTRKVLYYLASAKLAFKNPMLFFWGSDFVKSIYC